MTGTSLSWLSVLSLDAADLAELDSILASHRIESLRDAQLLKRDDLAEMKVPMALRNRLLYALEQSAPTQSAPAKSGQVDGAGGATISFHKFPLSPDKPIEGESCPDYYARMCAHPSCFSSSNLDCMCMCRRYRNSEHFIVEARRRPTDSQSADR